MPEKKDICAGDTSIERRIVKREGGQGDIAFDAVFVYIEQRLGGVHAARHVAVERIHDGAVHAVHHGADEIQEALRRRGHTERQGIDEEPVKAPIF